MGSPLWVWIVVCCVKSVKSWFKSVLLDVHQKKTHKKKHCWNKLLQTTLWWNSVWIFISIFPSHSKLYSNSPREVSRRKELRKEKGKKRVLPLPHTQGNWVWPWSDWSLGKKENMRSFVRACAHPFYPFKYCFLETQKHTWTLISPVPRLQAPQHWSGCIAIFLKWKLSRDRINSLNSFKILVYRKEQRFINRNCKLIKNTQV